MRGPPLSACPIPLGECIVLSYTPVRSPAVPAMVAKLRAALRAIEKAHAATVPVKEEVGLWTQKKGKA